MISDKLSRAIEHQQIAGWKGLWLALNESLLLSSNRQDYAAEQIRLARQMDGIVAAEIGVWEGKHANYLSRKLDIETFYLIDPYDAYEEYEEDKSDQIAMQKAREQAHRRLGDDESVVWIEEYSGEAATKIQEPLDYVYIDGNHGYEYVKSDLETYYPLLSDRGIIAGHDFTGGGLGVVRAVADFAAENNLQLNLEARSSEWYIISDE